MVSEAQSCFSSVRAALVASELLLFRASRMSCFALDEGARCALVRHTVF
jgi:hypothetical protein